jgi:hypothetical protein
MAKYFPELRVKLKTTRVEAQFIRVEVERARNPLRAAYLTSRRRGQVRDEARAANLAYGFLRGRSYIELEREARTEPNWNRVLTIAQMYGLIPPKGGARDRLIEQSARFTDWLAEAKEIWDHDNLVREEVRAEKRLRRQEQKALRLKAQENAEAWKAAREAKRIAWAREEARQGRFPFGDIPEVREPEAAIQD